MASAPRSTTRPHARSRRGGPGTITVPRAWFSPGILGEDALDAPKHLALSRRAGRYLSDLFLRLGGKSGAPRSRVKARDAKAGAARLTRADALDILELLRLMTNRMLLSGHKDFARQIRTEAQEVRRRLLKDPASPVTRARARG